MSRRYRIIFSLAFSLLANLVCYECFAQINFNFDPSNFRVVIFSNKTSGDVKFDWTMSPNAQRQIATGIRQFKAEKFAEAIRSLDSALIEDDGLWMAHFYRGQALRAEGKTVRAEADFRKMIKQQPLSSAGFIELGKTYIIQRRYLKADSVFDLTLKLNPGAAGPVFYQSFIAYEEGNVEKARRLISKAIDRDPGNSKAYVFRGAMKIYGKPNRSNLEDFTKAIEVNPDDANAYMWRGFVYFCIDKPAEGLYDWDKMVLLSNNDPERLLMRGKLKIAMDNYNGAFEDIQKAVEATPVSEDEYTGGKNLMESKTGFQSACRYLIKNGRFMNQQALLILKRAYGEMVAEEYLASIASIEAAENIQRSATSYYFKGLVCDKLRKYDSAFKYYDQALKLDNDIYEAHKRRGYYRSVIHDVAGAYDDLNQMKRILPSSYAVFRLSGEIKYSLKDYYGALLDLTKYLKSDSSNIEVLIARSVTRTAIADYKGANEDFMRVAAIDSSYEIFPDVLHNFKLGKDTAGAVQYIHVREKRKGLIFVHWVAIGDAYLDFNRWEDLRSAIPKIQKSFDLTKNKLLAYSAASYEWRLTYLEARLDYHDRRYEECERQMTKLLRTNDSMNTEMLYYRGMCNLALGNNRKARQDLEVPAKSNFKDALTRYNSIKSW